ncbi:MAG TPA: DUF4241 domain-containing protein [Acidimicrobiales bacterium]|nr:DUF4241 domain-containing protein [Acidimicrobiales bacterium]
MELPDGQLVACDPYVAEAHVPPFTTVLAPGEYEAVIARSHVGPDHERNAAAILLRSDNARIIGWEMAVTAGQDLTTLGTGEFFGYGVDAGVGMLGSPEGQAAATAQFAADAGMLDDDLSRALLDAPLEAVVARPTPGSPRITIFRSGWGDGSYPTWLGRGENGQVVVVVNDLLLVEDPYSSESQPPPPSEPPVPPAQPGSGDGLGGSDASEAREGE